MKTKDKGVWRLAFVCLALLLVLIFAGAVVRVTGSGLGCPDWPTCWGRLIPPTQVEEVDFEKLDFERFERSAKRFGRDPGEVTKERLRERFDGVQTWIEYVNRLLALPVLVANFILMVVAWRRGILRWCGVGAFLLVILNAVVGIVVVASGLHSGVVTIHMALAFAQLFLLTYMIWAGGGEGRLKRRITGAARWQVMVLLACVMIEWAMGSQIREMTDALQMERGVGSRATWMEEISGSWVYLIHRSFSWSILVAALWVGHLVGWRGFVPRLVLGVVGCLMVMGVILSMSGIHAVVQVLHVGLAGVLVSAVFYWWLAAVGEEKDA